MKNANEKDKKTQILESAIHLFSKSGFNKTSTKEIAKNAGVAEGTIFRYFKTKNDLLYSIFDQGMDIIVDKLIVQSLGAEIKKNIDKSDVVILKALIKNRLNLIKSHFPIIKIFFTELMYHEHLQKRFADIMMNRGIKVISDYIEEGMNQGRFRKGDPNLVSRYLVGAVFSHIIQNKFMPGLLSQYSEDEQIDSMLDFILHGLLNENNMNEGELNENK